MCKISESVSSQTVAPDCVWPRRSSSGVVNVYDHDACLQESNPKPLRAIMNLLTPATSLRFNSSAEILAIASSAADEAMRLVRPSPARFTPLQNALFCFF